MKKVYVDVMAKYQTSGYVKPLWIVWPDGREFEVDKIIDVQKAASLNVGGTGIRFTCRIQGKVTYLFLEENKWFMEGKD